jgi:hypothetical protein
MRLRMCVLCVLIPACARESVPPNPVEGLITAIEGDRLSLESTNGDTYGFVIADPTVPLNHLRVHQRDRLPVHIVWVDGNGARRATSITDAPQR